MAESVSGPTLIATQKIGQQRQKVASILPRTNDKACHLGGTMGATALDRLACEAFLLPCRRLIGTACEACGGIDNTPANPALQQINQRTCRSAGTCVWSLASKD